MPKQFQFTLEAFDAFQLLDGSTGRAEQWEAAAKIMETGSAPDDRYSALECASAEEATSIARHYRELINDLEKQIALQAA